MQTEIIPPGVVALVREGIMTGTHKAIHPGKESWAPPSTPS